MPAVGIEMARSLATAGRMPAMTNSDVPMAKAARNSESRDSGMSESPEDNRTKRMLYNRGRPSFRERKMAHEEQEDKSLAAKAAWPLLVLTAVLQVYFGLSIVTYVFMGVPNPVAMLGGWTAATMAGLQSVAAFVA